MYFSESQRKSITLSGPQSAIRNFQDPNAFAVEKVSEFSTLCGEILLSFKILIYTQICVYIICAYIIQYVI